MSLSKVKRYQRTEKRPGLRERPISQASRSWSQVVRGVLAGLGPDGTPLVDFTGNPAGQPVAAVSTVTVGLRDQSREAVLLFEDGDPRRPILLGLVQSPGSQASLEVSLDGERVSLNAEREIVLRCGEASITLTRAGKVIIRGAYLLSRSSGVNRIKGGSIQLN